MTYFSGNVFSQKDSLLFSIVLRYLIHCTCSTVLLQITKYIYIDKLMFPPIKDKFFSLNVVTEHDLSRAGKVVIIKMTFNEIYLP